MFFSATECFWIPWCQAGLMPWTVLYSVFHSVLPFKGRIGNCWHSGGRYFSLLPASTLNPLLRRVWCEIHLLQIHAESLSSHWKFPPEIWRKPFPVEFLFSKNSSLAIFLSLCLSVCFFVSCSVSCKTYGSPGHKQTWLLCNAGVNFIKGDFILSWSLRNKWVCISYLLLSTRIAAGGTWQCTKHLTYDWLIKNTNWCNDHIRPKLLLHSLFY